MQWLNEPASWQRAGDEIKVNVDPGTDFWRETGYGYIRDSGHVYGEILPGDLDVSVRVRASFTSQYDQVGVMLHADGETWLKTGLECFEGRSRLSTVLTLGRSSWMVSDLPETMDEITLRVSRRGDAVEVRYSADAGSFDLAALVYLPADREVLAGVMCAAPEGTGFGVTFRDLRITGREWTGEPADGEAGGESGWAEDLQPGGEWDAQPDGGWGQAEEPVAGWPDADGDSARPAGWESAGEPGAGWGSGGEDPVAGWESAGEPGAGWGGDGEDPAAGWESAREPGAAWGGDGQPAAADWGTADAKEPAPPPWGSAGEPPAAWGAGGGEEPGTAWADGGEEPGAGWAGGGEEPGAGWAGGGEEPGAGWEETPDPADAGPGQVQPPATAGHEGGDTEDEPAGGSGGAWAHLTAGFRRPGTADEPGMAWPGPPRDVNEGDWGAQPGDRTEPDLLALRPADPEPGADATVKAKAKTPLIPPPLDPPVDPADEWISLLTSDVADE